jgi:cytochrome P450/NADPH-cytochrome P450 reductase
LASIASHHGFRVAVVNPIDLAKHEIRPNNPVILFISSYEGQPPDNAKDFVAWIQSFVGNETNGIAYAVFDAGNSEWHQTFHKIPRLIDRKLTEHGGERLVPLGLTDVAKKNPLPFEMFLGMLCSIRIRQ